MKLQLLRNCSIGKRINKWTDGTDTVQKSITICQFDKDVKIIPQRKESLINGAGTPGCLSINNEPLCLLHNIY